MAYVSLKAEDLVLSLEAMTCHGMVNDIDDSTVASVHQINSSAPSSGGDLSGGGGSMGGGPGCPGGGDQQYEGMNGGQLTLDW